MGAFDYLVIVISLILGLTLANVLGGLARLIHARDRRAPFWPSVLWAIWLLGGTIQHWWADYGLRLVQFRFSSFVGMLLIPIELYLLSELVLPKGGDDEVDLASWFERNRRWFYGLLICVVASSYVEEYLVSGTFQKKPGDSAFLAFFALMSVVGFFVSNRRVQAAIATLAVVLLGFYIALLFMTLK
jgi:hypothetical protein